MAARSSAARRAAAPRDEETDARHKGQGGDQNEPGAVASRRGRDRTEDGRAYQHARESEELRPAGDDGDPALGAEPRHLREKHAGPAYRGGAVERAHRHNSQDRRLKHPHRAVAADERAARKPGEHRRHVGEPDPPAHRGRRLAEIARSHRREHRGHRQRHQRERLHRQRHRDGAYDRCGARPFAAVQNRERGKNLAIDEFYTTGLPKKRRRPCHVAERLTAWFAVTYCERIRPGNDMSRNAGFLRLALLLAALASPLDPARAQTAQEPALEAARKEREVVWYTAMNIPDAEPVRKLFQEKY